MTLLKATLVTSGKVIASKFAQTGCEALMSGSYGFVVSLRVMGASLLCFLACFSCGCGSATDTTRPSPPVGPTFQLSVTPPAAGSGTITSNPSGIDCPPTCTASFPENTRVRLNATPAQNFIFAGWTGGCSGIGGCSVKLSERKHVAAEFTRGETLSVILAGAGGGTILSTPIGINCPNVCSAVFPTGTAVTLTENPAMNDMFAAWSGACSGRAACSVKLSAPASVTATFDDDSGTGSSVIAYIFTPDIVTLNTNTFALLSNGALRPANANLPTESAMAATLDGVALAHWSSSSSSSATVQSYALSADGTLQPKGAAQPFGAEKYFTLASDSNDVFVLSDEGIFGYQDEIGGLIALPAISLNPEPPYPCTLAEESAGTCSYEGGLSLSPSNALMMQSSYVGYGSANFTLNTFDRSAGDLVSQGPIWGWNYSLPVLTPDGRFGFGFDPYVSSRLLRLDLPGNGVPVWNVLSNGQQISDGFAQLLITRNGAFLLGVVFDGAESPRVRVFSINNATGDLTEVAGSPFLTGQFYFSSAAIDPTGQFLLLVDSPCMDASSVCMQTGELVSMSINSTTGTLTAISNIQDGKYPNSLVVAPISQ